MRRLLLITLLAISTLSWAYTPSDSAKLSILTCSSGAEVYKIYGHTAIRFQDANEHRNIDLVYNYGMFSFDEPHFFIRFVRGYNYYLLGRESYRNFARRYERGGETVTEQTLNLSPEEVKILFNALETNAEPENCKYLYNVFYDNCATRVYKILEKEISGGIIWDNDCPEASFRDLIHEYNGQMPLSQMGIDVVFSVKADKKTTFHEQMFLPEKLMRELGTALKADKSPLISETKTIITGRPIHSKNKAMIFIMSLSLLCFITILIRFKLTKALRAYRIIIFSFLGLTSVVVSFIAFCSIHPTVLPNINLIWINPLWLVVAGVFICKKQPKIFWQKLLNIWAIIITIFLLCGCCGLFYLNPYLVGVLGYIIIISYKRIY